MCCFAQTDLDRYRPRIRLSPSTWALSDSERNVRRFPLPLLRRAFGRLLEPPRRQKQSDKIEEFARELGGRQGREPLSFQAYQVLDYRDASPAISDMKRARDESDVRPLSVMNATRPEISRTVTGVCWIFSESHA